MKMVLKITQGKDLIKSVNQTTGKLDDIIFVLRAVANVLEEDQKRPGPAQPPTH